MDLSGWLLAAARNRPLCKQWRKQSRGLFIFLDNKNSSGWPSRLGMIAQDTTGDPDTLCLCILLSLAGGSHPHGHKRATETLCIARTLKTGGRGKAKEVWQPTWLPFRKFSRNSHMAFDREISLVLSVLTLFRREVGKCSFIRPAHCHPPQNKG